jgi:hypothetical protein
VLIFPIGGLVACVVFFAKNRPSGGAAVLPTRVRGVSLALMIPAVLAVTAATGAEARALYDLSREQA